MYQPATLKKQYDNDLLISQNLLHKFINTDLTVLAGHSTPFPYFRLKHRVHTVFWVFKVKPLHRPAMADWTDNPFAEPAAASNDDPFADPAVTTASKKGSSSDYDPFASAPGSAATIRQQSTSTPKNIQPTNP